MNPYSGRLIARFIIWEVIRYSFLYDPIGTIEMISKACFNLLINCVLL